MSRGIWTCVNKKLYFFVFIIYSILNINSNVFLKEKKIFESKRETGKNYYTKVLFFFVCFFFFLFFLRKFYLGLKNFLVKILRRVVAKRWFLVKWLAVHMQKPSQPVENYLFKINNKDTRTTYLDIVLMS